VNVRAVVLLSRYFIPEMMKMKEAYILNVGSLSAWYSIPFKSLYAATKAFVVNFSRAIRTEFKHTGISVSVVNPNGVRTNEGTLARINSHGRKGKYTTVAVEKVAHEAIKGMFKGKFLIIPGVLNRILLAISYIIPNWIQQKLLYREFFKEAKLLPAFSKVT
jgi:short-subunit dehydrogenase